MKTKISRTSLLIILCWLVYTCSYIGKLSYNANITPIGLALGVSNTELGTVSTFFFFAYGIGQVVNGLLCKKYNAKYVIFACLLVSSAINAVFPFIPNFSIAKYLWLLNGIAMSFLWTLLIRLLSEQLPKKDIPRAVLAMGTTVATGTFIVYGMSSLMVAVATYHVTFCIAAAIMAASAIVWICSFNRLTSGAKDSASDVTEEITEAPSGGMATRSVMIFIAVLAFFAVGNNFVKDGLTAWTPQILDETYNTPSWLSILLTLLLPTMAIGGAGVALRLQKRTNSFIGSCVILFAASAALIGVVLGLFSFPVLPLTVVCFAIVSCLMAGVNNVITSMVPLHMKDRISSGKLAGVLNGFCYLGSTVSTYSLGAIADSALGWYGVFYVLLAVTALAIATGSLYLIFNKGKKI